MENFFFIISKDSPDQDDLIGTYEGILLTARNRQIGDISPKIAKNRQFGDLSLNITKFAPEIVKFT